MWALALIPLAFSAAYATGVVVFCHKQVKKKLDKDPHFFDTDD